MLLSWVDGVETSQVSVLNRGLAYGDGLFETMRCSQGRLPLWSYHLQRLEHGCQVLDIEIDPGLVSDQVQRFVRTATQAGCYDGVIKLVLIRGLGGRGYSPQGCGQPSILLQCHELPPPQSEPVVLPLCRRYLLPLNSTLAGLKHLNRLDNILIQRECLALGSDDGIAMDQRGCLIEAVSSNLVMIRNQTLVSPSLEYSGVAGVMRAFIRDVLAPELNLQWQETDIREADIQTFDGAFLCNSVRGIRSVAAINDHEFSGSLIIESLQKSLSRYLQAVDVS